MGERRARMATPGPHPKKRARRDARLAIGVRHNAMTEDVASAAQAAIINRDRGALRPGKGGEVALQRLLVEAGIAGGDVVVPLWRHAGVVDDEAGAVLLA